VRHLHHSLRLGKVWHGLLDLQPVATGGLHRDRLWNEGHPRTVP
jgi:hypothetical protein